jgi:hypothetical protein
LGAKSCLGIFLENFKPSRFFSYIKNDFSFCGIILILKMGLLQKIKYLQTLAIYIYIYIYMVETLSSSPFQISKLFPHIRSTIPGIAR